MDGLVHNVSGSCTFPVERWRNGILVVGSQEDTPLFILTGSILGIGRAVAFDGRRRKPLISCAKSTCCRSQEPHTRWLRRFDEERVGRCDAPMIDMGYDRIE